MLKAFTVVAAVTGIAIFQFTERFPEYAGPLPSITAINTITGAVTKVRDGDTIEVEGQPIRFGSLDCAESGTVKGDAATNRLRELLGRKTLTCHLNGRSSYDRAIASCVLDGKQDVASTMIEDGYCRRYW